MPSRSSVRQEAIVRARYIWAQNPLYLDTETTGVNGGAQIVEISVLDSDGSTLLEQLVRPNGLIPPDVTRIHHITDDMVRDAPMWPQVWPAVRRALGTRPVVIYNADFDLRIMRQSHACYRMRWDFDESLAFCLMKLYARFNGEWDQAHGDYRWCKLEAAARRCRLRGINGHRAKDDALLARELLCYLANQQ